MDRFSDRRDDRGFTLFEMLLSIVILGAISGAIATSTIVLVRNDRVTTERLAASRYEHTLNAWLSADVQSATSAGLTDAATDPANTTGCAGGASFTGRNLVRLELHPGADGVAQVVSYRLTGTGPYTLVRTWCEGTGAANSIPIADGVPTLQDATATVTAGASSYAVALAVRVQGNDPTRSLSFRASASTRLPTAQALPTTTTTPVPTTTTLCNATVTFPAPDANREIFDSSSGGANRLATIGSFGVTANALCNNIALEVAIVENDKSFPVTPNNSTSRATAPLTQKQKAGFPTGSYNIYVRRADTKAAVGRSIYLVVNGGGVVPCAATGIYPTPTPITIKQKKLTQAFAWSVTTTIGCERLLANGSYAFILFGTANQVVPLRITGGPTDWSATTPVGYDVGNWGSYNIYFGISSNPSPPSPATVVLQAGFFDMSDCIANPIGPACR